MSILSDYASAFDAHTREVISGAAQKPAEKKAPDRPPTALDYFGALFVRCRCSLSLCSCSRQPAPLLTGCALRPQRIACVFLFSGLLVGVWYSWILYEARPPAAPRRRALRSVPRADAALLLRR